MYMLFIMGLNAACEAMIVLNICKNNLNVHVTDLC
jgi:hypothetical protein